MIEKLQTGPHNIGRCHKWFALNWKNTLWQQILWKRTAACQCEVHFLHIFLTCHNIYEKWGWRMKDEPVFWWYTWQNMCLHWIWWVKANVTVSCRLCKVHGQWRYSTMYATTRAFPLRKYEKKDWEREGETGFSSVPAIKAEVLKCSSSL